MNNRKRKRKRKLLFFQMRLPVLHQSCHAHLCERQTSSSALRIFSAL